MGSAGHSLCVPRAGPVLESGGPFAVYWEDAGDDSAPRRLQSGRDVTVHTRDSVLFPQVQRAKQERLSHFLAPLELQASRDPLGSKGRKVLLKSSLPGYHRASLVHFSN